MKVTTSLYSVIQQCQVHFLFFIYFIHDLTEKGGIRKSIVKKKIIGKNSVIILICQKLG